MGPQRGAARKAAQLIATADTPSNKKVQQQLPAPAVKPEVPEIPEKSEKPEKDAISSKSSKSDKKSSKEKLAIEKEEIKSDKEERFLLNLAVRKAKRKSSLQNRGRHHHLRPHLHPHHLWRPSNRRLNRPLKKKRKRLLRKRSVPARKVIKRRS